MRNAAIATVVMSGLLAGAACSGSGGGSGEKPAADEAAPKQTAASPSPGACDLVTLAEAQAIYGSGIAVVPSRTSTDTGPAAVLSNCLYATSGDSMKTLNVLFRTSRVGNDVLGDRERFVAENRKLLGDDFEVETVEGLAAPAAWQPVGPSGTLFAFLGDRHLAINADPAGGRSGREIATELMAKALARLGS